MPASAACAAYSYYIIITVAALLTNIILIERAFAALLQAYVPTNDSICSYYNYVLKILSSNVYRL